MNGTTQHIDGVNTDLTENADGYDLWMVIEGERTRVWCGKCACHVEHKLLNLLDRKCRGLREDEKDRNMRGVGLEAGRRVCANNAE